MNRTRLSLGLGVLLLTAGVAARAADYWSYTYQDLEITAEGTATDAVTVARRLNAMDEALRTLLHLPRAAGAPPTRVYSLPPSDLAALDAVWSADGGGFFRAGPFKDFAVLRDDGRANPEVDAARARALLSSWGLARLPEWYRDGVALFMSAARFDHEQMTLGLDTADRSVRLAHDWIPMSQFLRLPASDPSLHRSPAIEAAYQAQCWWMVHLSLLDGVLDKVMPQYLQRLLMGESQESAYAAAFGIPYDELDNYLKKVKRNLVLKHYTAALPDLTAAAAPQKLTDAELKARLAELLLTHEARSPTGAQLALQALATEPKNERALLSLAHHELTARHYAQAQEYAQQSGALAELSAASHCELGALWATLAQAKDEGMPGTGSIDTKAARAAARTHLQRAIELAPDDPNAPYQLGWLLSGQGDVVATRELLPKVEAAFYRRPESAEFAELLVRMNSIAGNAADVFKYAVAEQRLAATDAERARATARVERLRAQLKAAQ